MALLQQLRATGAGTRLAGDSRSDSPGYSAKYWTYSLMETSMNKIVDIRLVQVKRCTYCGNSRFDSPGYSAKYGTYSLMETSMNKTAGSKLVHVKRYT